MARRVAITWSTEKSPHGQECSQHIFRWVVSSQSSGYTANGQGNYYYISSTLSITTIVLINLNMEMSFMK
jgi:hypothetical protein